MSPLHAIFEAAKQFGLTDDEVWTTLDEYADRSGDDATVNEYVDELAGALASQILANERRTLKRRGIPVKDPDALDHSQHTEHS